MDIFINTDKSPAQLQAKATGSPLSAFKVKRGAVVSLSVTVLGSQTASGLRMGIKAKGNYEGELLILAEADSGEQTELGMRFDLKLVAAFTHPQPIQITLWSLYGTLRAARTLYSRDSR